MPQTIADVANEKGAMLLRRDHDWRYSVTDQSWNFTDGQGELAGLPLPQVPLPNAATALRASGLNVAEQALRDGIHHAMLPGAFRLSATRRG